VSNLPAAAEVAVAVGVAAREGGGLTATRW